MRLESCSEFGRVISGSDPLELDERKREVLQAEDFEWFACAVYLVLYVINDEGRHPPTVMVPREGVS